MSTKSPFHKTITSLPEADIAFKGVKGWLSQAKDHNWSSWTSLRLAKSHPTRTAHNGV